MRLASIHAIGRSTGTCNTQDPGRPAGRGASIRQILAMLPPSNTTREAVIKVSVHPSR
jgi:hypothetical protein